MFGNKKLLKRIKSLEERCGLVFEDDKEYPNHAVTAYGWMQDMNKVKAEFDKRVLKIKDSDY